MKNQDIDLAQSQKINYTVQQVDGLKKECRDLAGLVNKKQVEKINKILEKDSPQVMVDALETVVALMRNHQRATNIDVELYFKDYKKLQMKMERMDPASLDFEIAK